MSTLRRTYVGLGLALVTGLVLTAGSALASAADAESDAAPAGEVVDQAIPGSTYMCSMSGPSTFERAAARLTVLPNGIYCMRERIGGLAYIGTPSCHQVARQIGCQVVN